MSPDTNTPTAARERHHPYIASSRFGSYAHCSCGWSSSGARLNRFASVLWAEHVAAGSVPDEDTP